MDTEILGFTGEEVLREQRRHHRSVDGPRQPQDVVPRPGGDSTPAREDYRSRAAEQRSKRVVDEIGIRHTGHRQRRHRARRLTCHRNFEQVVRQIQHERNPGGGHPRESFGDIRAHRLGSTNPAVLGTGEAGEPLEIEVLEVVAHVRSTAGQQQHCTARSHRLHKGSRTVRDCRAVCHGCDADTTGHTGVTVRHRHRATFGHGRHELTAVVFDEVTEIREVGVSHETEYGADAELGQGFGCKLVSLHTFSPH